MKSFSPHLLVVPVVLPLLTAALLLVLGEERRRLKSVLNVSSCLVGLGAAIAILRHLDGANEIVVYLPSNWEAPYGIALVADRLSALMLVLVSLLGACGALYAEAGWARAGVYFHALFQIQLMGLNGAFLTGDLFNLFVFFEVMLAASYGLQLHGSGGPRVRAGLHYIAVNLLASSLLLIGLAVLYGVVGTLSMADVADKVALVPERDRGLLHAGAAICALAFLIKAAIWPLNAWLVPAYAATSAPVAALFAVMTKVGIYTLLRLWTLLFSAEAGPSALFGQDALVFGGLATIAFGTLGLWASGRLGRIAGFAIIVSAGTLLATLGLGVESVTAAALFYMVSATLGASALFLLIELSERLGVRQPAPLRDDAVVLPGEDTNLDDEEVPLVGRVIPLSLALLALAFMSSAVLVAGLPPLSSFLAKVALLRALASEGTQASWLIFAALLLSGLAATVTLARAGIRHFWISGGGAVPRLRRVEAAAFFTLLGAAVALTAYAEQAMRYTRATAASLHAPRPYIDAVLSARVRPGPTRSALEQEGVP